MLKIEKALLTGLMITFFLTMCGFTAQRDDIADKVLRFHVVANSDSEEDQALKLRVRDRILRETAGLFSEYDGKAVSERGIEKRIPLLRGLALDEIHRQGYEYDVQIFLGKTHFNTRAYEEVTLPAGTYDALNVIIGEGKGKNWWCVMFPPMCLPSAEEKEVLSDVLSEEEMETVEGEQGYEIRFKFLEIYEEFMERIRSK